MHRVAVIVRRARSLFRQRPTARQLQRGYGGYYGASPWGYYPGHPVYIGGGGGEGPPAQADETSPLTF